MRAWLLSVFVWRGGAKLALVLTLKRVKASYDDKQSLEEYCLLNQTLYTYYTHNFGTDSPSTVHSQLQYLNPISVRLPAHTHHSLFQIQK
jgi:hypothetical protein